MPACYSSIQPGWQGEVGRMQARYESGLQLIDAADCSLFYCSMLSKQGRHGTAVYEISDSDEIFIPRPEIIPQTMGDDGVGPIMRFHPFVDAENMIAYCNFDAVETVKIEHHCLFVGGNDNIFHFFYDILGRIVSYQYFENFEDESSKYLFLNVSDWQLQVLDFLGIDRDRVLNISTQVNKGVLFEFEKLYTTLPAPSPLTHQHLRQMMGSRLDVATDDRYRRIYLSRSEPPPNNRVANEEEVCNGLRAKGFEVIYPDQLSVAEKVHIIGNADTIVCAPLSGQANHIFAKDSAQFINLMPWASGQSEVLHDWARAWLRHTMPLIDRSAYLFGELTEPGQELNVMHPNTYDVGELMETVANI